MPDMRASKSADLCERIAPCQMRCSSISRSASETYGAVGRGVAGSKDIESRRQTK